MFVSLFIDLFIGGGLRLRWLSGVLGKDAKRNGKKRNKMATENKMAAAASNQLLLLFLLLFSVSQLSPEKWGGWEVGGGLWKYCQVLIT